MWGTFPGGGASACSCWDPRGGSRRGCGGASRGDAHGLGSSHTPTGQAPAQRPALAQRRRHGERRVLARAALPAWGPWGAAPGAAGLFWGCPGWGPRRRGLGRSTLRAGGKGAPACCSEPARPHGQGCRAGLPGGAFWESTGPGSTGPRRLPQVQRVSDPGLRLTLGLEHAHRRASGGPGGPFRWRGRSGSAAQAWGAPTPPHSGSTPRVWEDQHRSGIDKS